MWRFRPLIFFRRQCRALRMLMSFLRFGNQLNHNWDLSFFLPAYEISPPAMPIPFPTIRFSPPAAKTMIPLYSWESHGAIASIDSPSCSDRALHSQACAYCVPASAFRDSPLQINALSYSIALLSDHCCISSVHHPYLQCRSLPVMLHFFEYRFSYLLLNLDTPSGHDEPSPPVRET